jgi:anti-sigma B factor antagonist
VNGDPRQQLDLRDFPVDHFQRARQHAAAVQRELDVLRVEGARADHLPRRSDEIVTDLDARFTGYRATMDILDGLVAQGTDHADVTIPVLGDPEERARAVQALADLLDEVDSYCESGDQLLTVVTPPDLRAFRAWLFREVIGQLRGASPTPWTDDASASTRDAPVGAHGGTPLVVRESGALDLADAARLRQRLQAAFTDSDADVVLDLTDVEFVDSVILSLLVTAHKRFVAGGRRLSLLVPSNLLRLFELTGLVGVLDVRLA